MHSLGRKTHPVCQPVIDNIPSLYTTSYVPNIHIVTSLCSNLAPKHLPIFQVARYLFIVIFYNLIVRGTAGLYSTATFLHG